MPQPELVRPEGRALARIECFMIRTPQCESAPRRAMHMSDVTVAVTIINRFQFRAFQRSSKLPEKTVTAAAAASTVGKSRLPMYLRQNRPQHEHADLSRYERIAEMILHSSTHAGSDCEKIQQRQAPSKHQPAKPRRGQVPTRAPAQQCGGECHPGIKRDAKPRKYRGELEYQLV